MEIECKFEVSIFGVYSCEVLNASINKPNVDIASFKGSHEPWKNNGDVDRVHFRNVKVEYLKLLEIYNCGLKEISREDLIGLEKLILNLNENQIKSLPDDLFTNKPSLKHINLSDNRIELASSKLIEPIARNQLECFYLNKNTSIDEYYCQGANTGCKTIQELMAKINEKCKQHEPPKPKCPSNCYITAEREIFKGFNELRLLGRFTDFVITVGSTAFPVNKIILAVQSSVLAEMFEVKTEGRFDSILEISDLSVEAVEAFLDYRYGRKLPNAQNATEIFKLAAKYEVKKLKIICEQIIQENLDESNAFGIFKLTCGPHKSDKLKIAAFRKLQEKFGDELDDDLINNLDKLQKIVGTKQLLDDLMTKPSAKKQRLN